VTETAEAPAAETTEREPYAWTLTPAELALTEEKIAKINARAAKRGWTGRVELGAEQFERTTKNAVGIDVTEILYHVTITGQAPCYDGWTFTAALDWDQHAGLIVRTAPGVESVDREGLREGWCDHCKTARRRTKTMLVTNAETGKQKQIGSTCIKDFLGWVGRPAFIYADEIGEEVDDFIGGFGGARDNAYTVETVLALAWACTMAWGFVPASSYDKQPTSAAVKFILDPPLSARGVREQLEEMRAALAPFTAEAAAKAVAVREWIASGEFSGNSEYVINLKAVAAAERVSFRNIGILASAPQAWAKAQQASLVRKAKEQKPSEWFGTAPDKAAGIKGSAEVFTGVIETIRQSEALVAYNVYKTSTIYTLRNEETGQIAKWFASSPALGQEEGVTVTIKGTVKKHEEWQGIKATVLTRCKLVD
jgi:hypothetical protein